MKKNKIALFIFLIREGERRGVVQGKRSICLLGDGGGKGGTAAIKKENGWALSQNERKGDSPSLMGGKKMQFWERQGEKERQPPVSLPRGKKGEYEKEGRRAFIH